MSIARTNLGNPSQLQLVFVAQGADYYPNSGGQATGQFFTYQPWWLATRLPPPIRHQA